MSRLRSNPAASRPAARSTPAAGGGRGVYVQSAKSDIFVVMLGIALGAILLGCLLLILTMNRYGFSVKPTAMITVPTSLSVASSGIPSVLSTVRL